MEAQMPTEGIVLSSIPAKFQPAEIQVLRNELLDLVGDYGAACEVIRAFLAEHGYGSSREAVLEAAIEFGTCGYSLQAIERALDKSALMD